MLNGAGSDETGFPSLLRTRTSELVIHELKKIACDFLPLDAYPILYHSNMGSNEQPGLGKYCMEG